MERVGVQDFQPSSRASWHHRVFLDPDTPMTMTIMTTERIAAYCCGAPIANATLVPRALVLPPYWRALLWRCPHDSADADVDRVEEAIFKILQPCRRRKPPAPPGGNGLPAFCPCRRSFSCGAGNITTTPPYVRACRILVGPIVNIHNRTYSFSNASL